MVATSRALLRFGRESPIVFLLFCNPVVALSSVKFFFLFVSWYLLAFRGSPSLSPSSSLRGIVGTVRYVLDLWII